MRLTKTCREVTQLVLQGEDRKLSATERIAVRVHQTMCGACTRFAQQVRFMRGAMGQWRRYSDGTDEGKDGEAND